MRRIISLTLTVIFLLPLTFTGAANALATAVDPKTHPANAGKDFIFYGTISEDVLKNYLSRSMTFTWASWLAIMNTDNAIPFILNSGAKYISRFSTPWEPETDYGQMVRMYKPLLDALHATDPDLLIETCMFETVWKSCVKTPIPGWVFEAFGLAAEERHFNYDKMLFPDGRFINHWGSGASVPDITQIETQMYFYYRACCYIDAGFESIHWGQIHLVGQDDEKNGWKAYHKVISMVRSYAKEHARRGMLLNNAHTTGVIGSDGKLLFDFHGYPQVMKMPAGATAHPPSEANPQEIVLDAGYWYNIYQKSLGGTTVSGWSCDSLPYFVEFDNYNGVDKGILNEPGVDMWPWGMDEVSWFANQPKVYRESYLSYAYNWVQETDPQGFLMVLGSRIAYMQDIDEMTNYIAFDKRWDDGEAIKKVWMNANALAPNLDTAHDWARISITSAVQKGLVPDDLQSNYANTITRAEFCRMAIRYIEVQCGKPVTDILKERRITLDNTVFGDTSDPIILAAYALGVTNGTGVGTFNPNGQFTRQQAATMLTNVCRTLGKDTANVPVAPFVDRSSASSWASGSIDYCFVEGIMQGVGNNLFNPDGTFTREQSIITFDNMS